MAVLYYWRPVIHKNCGKNVKRWQESKSWRFYINSHG